MTIPSRNVAVLGLDGVPFTLLNRLFASGVMPNLADIAWRGAFLQMDSTLPAVSSVAWTSFMTGENPGRHGIFGFTDLKPGALELHLPSFDDIRCPAIWQDFPEKKHVVVNLPFTYPAREINGVLISGFVAPVLDRSVYPADLVSWLRSRNYRIDVDAVRGRHNRKGLIEDLFETLRVREEVIFALMESLPWDLFIGVITGTDRLHHFFFDALDDPEHPFHEDCITYYRRVDQFVGRFTERLAGHTKLLVLSDHGFTTLRRQVYVNHILHVAGYLSFVRLNPQSIGDIAPSSLALAMDPTRIYLNTRDRFKRGLLLHREAIEVREKLKSDLENLRLRDVGIGGRNGEGDADRKLFKAILTREELYGEDCIESAPDLVIIPVPGYDPKASIPAPGASSKDIFTGMHTHDDAFLIGNDPALAHRLSRPHIADVAGLIRESLKAIEI